jgi:hypothetical protein
MSKIANKVYDILKELFPHNRIQKEHYINFRGTKLFFDFFLPDFGIFVEVQGEQHDRFVRHFHGSKEQFLESKKRDNLKITYVQESDWLDLIRINHDEDITADLIYDKINKVLTEKEGYYG